jgi:Ca2+/Na+ antiporter
MVIGLTVVSLRTSSPELGVSLQAVLAGDDGLVSATSLAAVAST